MLMGISAMAVPYFIEYQGKLIDKITAEPVTATNLPINFRIYDAETDGAIIWGESQTVNISGGIYNVLLGSGTPIYYGPLDNVVFSDDDLWLEVEVDGEILLPRTRIVSVPFAVRAGVADSMTNGAITTNMLSNNAITSAKIQDGSISSSDIQTGGISSGNIATGAVASSQVQDGSITAADLYGTACSDICVDANTTDCSSCDGRFVNQSGDTMQNTTAVNILNIIQDGTGNAIDADSDGGFAVRGESHADGYAGVAGYNYAGIGAGIFGQGTDKGIHGYSLYAWAGYFEGDTYMSDNVGIGTENPESKLHVSSYDSYFGMLKVENSNTGDNEATMAFIEGSDAIGGDYWIAGVGAWGQTNNFVIGRTAPKLIITPAGHAVVPVLEITGGSDLSEQFEVRGAPKQLAPAPGMVVSIDPEHPGHLMVSARAYDRRVAGIISGANGVKPGMLMGQKGSEIDGANPVALTGRVYCWADTSQGEIEPGDLLTTSDTPGHAMKVADYRRAQGAILGKAMSSLASGKGLVLVLVSLQ
jgi:hypothetical protein